MVVVTSQLRLRPPSRVHLFTSGDLPGVFWRPLSNTSDSFAYHAMRVGRTIAADDDEDDDEDDDDDDDDDDSDDDE